MPTTLKLTNHQADELRHRLCVVTETEDLLEDYGVTEEQVMDLYATIPVRGEWTVPDWAVELIREEAEAVAMIRQGQSQSLVNGREYAACRRDVRAFSAIAESLYPA